MQKPNYWLSLGLMALTLASISGARAGQPEAAPAEKHWTGTISYVEPSEHVLKLKNWTQFQKTFNLGENCAYALWEKGDGTAASLRPGQKVTVNYQEAHGVLIVSRVEQEPLRIEGLLVSLSPDQHKLVLQQRGPDKTVQIATDCQVILRGAKPGTLADLRPGNYVTVTYETPGGTVTARQIAQTSQTFTGTLTAIDLGEKTLKAKSVFEAKKFNLANHCAIVINGRIDGKLSDLKPNDKLQLNYDEINGVNVVNRIAPAESDPASSAKEVGQPQG